jgi:hypothetical protein
MKRIRKKKRNLQTKFTDIYKKKITTNNNSLKEAKLESNFPGNFS